MPPKISLIGKRFGRLKVVEEALPLYSGRAKITRWICQCDCGKTIIIRHGNLSDGHSQSCGCLKAEQIRTRWTTHGYSTGQHRKLWQVWLSMLRRCSNPQDKRWKDYGGRGITVCERWKVFENFLADMGDCPTGCSLDRIDNSKGYNLDNCRWATSKEQMRNSRLNHVLTVHGITGCVSELCEHFGIPYGRVQTRLHRGWSPEESFS